jgi:alpha-beta hydrolase superfamily lysophospholipase
MKHHQETSYGNVMLYRPEVSSSHEPILIVPGYSESLTHNKKLVNTLVRLGYDAMTYTQPRKRGKTGLTDPIARQGDIVLNVLDGIGGENKMHVVAHSLGCAAVLYAAMQQPERFASLTLMQPLGMVGEQTFGEMFRRVNRKVVRNQLGALKGRHLTHTSDLDGAAPLDKETKLRYVARVAIAQLAAAGILAKHPRLAVQEAKASGKYNITEHINEVAELGIPVHVVTADSDEMFDKQKVAAGYELISAHVTSYNQLSDVAAAHDTFWMHPERSASIIDQTISSK